MYPTKEEYRNCIPSNFSKLSDEEIEGVKRIQQNKCFTKYLIEQFFNVAGQTVFCIVTAAFLNIMYLYVMTKAAMVLGIIMIVSLEILFIAIICGFLYVALRSTDEISTFAFYCGACIMIMIAMLFNCLLYCYWDELSIAISIVNASAEFYVATKRIIYISLMCVICGLVVIYLCTTGMVWIISIDLIDQKKDFLANQSKVMNMHEFSLPASITNRTVYKIFVLLWLLFLIHANCQWITFFSVSTYYFDSNVKKEGEADVVEAIKNATIYHQGSLVLGSFIHPFLVPLRYLIECIYDYKSEHKPIKCIDVCGRFLLSIFNGAFLSFNKHAYAYQAITGDPYKKSAHNGLYINLKHCHKFYKAESIGEFYVIIGKLSITILNVLIYWALIHLSLQQNDFISLVGPILMMAVLTYFLSNVFLGIYDEIIMSILLCIAVDMDLNNDDTMNGPPNMHLQMSRVFLFHQEL